MVTASDDKTAKIWEVSSGDTLCIMAIPQLQSRLAISELIGLSEEEVVKKIIASLEGGISEYIKKHCCPTKVGVK